MSNAILCRGTLTLACAFVVSAAGCGSDATAPTASSTPATTSGAEQAAPRRSEPQVQGLLGTLSRFAIDNALQPRMRRFARCFQQRSSDVEMLGGRIELTFRVAVDGSVKWVFPKSSTVGDRETERCIVDVASKAHFHRPTGGEAEFTWPLEFDPADDVRPPVHWDADRVARVLSHERSHVLSRCRPKGNHSAYSVTAYVAPGGTVMAAGAAADDRHATDALDCVAEGVKSWDMPDPGSYPAKVTFELSGSP